MKGGSYTSPLAFFLASAGSDDCILDPLLRKRNKLSRLRLRQTANVISRVGATWRMIDMCWPIITSFTKFLWYVKGPPGPENALMFNIATRTYML